ncbi:MAG: branched-chain amino acid ABC transporter permease [Thalassovita sp.]
MSMLYLQLLLDGIVTGCAVGVIAVSFSYFYATSGIFNIAHAGVYTLAGYTAWWLVGMGVPFAFALASAVVVAALVGMAIQMLVYDRLELRGASPLVILIASIGVLAVLQNAMAMIFSPNIVQFDLGWRTTPVSILGLTLSIPQTLIVVSSCVLCVGMHYFSQRTNLGKRIRAVSSNRELAEITHMNPRAVLVIVIGISSALVAVPGVLVGVDQALQPYSALVILLTAVVAMIAGGIGSIGGAFFMAVLLSAIQSVSVAMVSGRWSVAVVFGIFILFILLRPSGLFRQRVSRTI